VLYLFGFDEIGVAVSDLYFVDPDPGENQEGAEHGVRLELRRLVPGELKGSIYSARPIVVDQLIWRVDLLESVDGEPGSFDRTHHHPGSDRWEPGKRVFDERLSDDPLKWLEERLSDPGEVLGQVGADDVARLRESAPEIVDTVRRLLGKVRSGELGTAPDGESGESVRASWL
jgi:hypothetical protein